MGNMNMKFTWCWLKCEEQEKEFPASASDEHEEEEKNACDEVDEMRDDDDNAIVEFREHNPQPTIPHTKPLQSPTSNAT